MLSFQPHIIVVVSIDIISKLYNTYQVAYSYHRTFVFPLLSSIYPVFYSKGIQEATYKIPVLVITSCKAGMSYFIGFVVVKTAISIKESAKPIRSKFTYVVYYFFWRFFSPRLVTIIVEKIECLKIVNFHNRLLRRSTFSCSVIGIPMNMPRKNVIYILKVCTLYSYSNSVRFRNKISISPQESKNISYIWCITSGNYIDIYIFTFSWNSKTSSRSGFSNNFWRLPKTNSVCHASDSPACNVEMLCTFFYSKIIEVGRQKSNFTISPFMSSMFRRFYVFGNSDIFYILSTCFIYYRFSCFPEYFCCFARALQWINIIENLYLVFSPFFHFAPPQISCIIPCIINVSIYIVSPKAMNEPFKPGRLDIGVDSACTLVGDYRPLRLEECVQLIRAQKGRADEQSE